MTVVAERGICAICGTDTEFYIHFEGATLREALCPHCKSVRRNRDLAKAISWAFLRDDAISLAKALECLKSLSVFEAQAMGPVHERMKTLPGYICSEYIDGVTPGTVQGGVRCEDLMALTFPPESFDLVITQDVFEHVPSPAQAFLEIRRVLKPFGFHIFTVPVHEGRRTAKRVSVKDGINMDLLPPVHHGDPLRQSGSLVYTDFGDDLPYMLGLMGLPTLMRHYRFYNEEDIPFIDNDEIYRRYLEDRLEGKMLKFFLYNSVVFVSIKLPGFDTAHFGAYE